MITFRTGTMADLSACRDLINQIWPEGIARFEAEYELFVNRVDIFDTFVGLVECDNKVVGMAMLYRANMAFDLLAMDWLALLPEFRGQGHGAMLTQKRLEIADDLKMPTILSTVRPDFFKQFGFCKMVQTSKEYSLLYRPVNGME
jgi:N-acetylglutamate synthase-like GNAT family acetyltransferase